MPTERQVDPSGVGVLFAEPDAGHGTVKAASSPGPGPGDHALAPGPKLLLSPAGAASALSISRSKVYRLLCEGRLQSVMLDGNRRIPLASLVRLIDDLLDVAALGDNGSTRT
ncbi:MAG: helix-turn-helix domain-containing protein [Acidimicrobiales bacterium]